MTAEPMRCCFIGCAKLFIPTRHGRQVYCSLACSAASKAKRMERRLCNGCGEAFWCKATSKQQSCSVACRGLSRTERGAHLERCRECHGLFDRPHECQGAARETYGFSMLALAEGWS